MDRAPGTCYTRRFELEAELRIQPLAKRRIAAHAEDVLAALLFDEERAELCCALGTLGPAGFCGLEKLQLVLHLHRDHGPHPFVIVSVVDLVVDSPVGLVVADLYGF